MRKLLVTTVIALAVLGGGYGTNTAQAQNTRAECPGILKGINYYRNTTWGWQNKLGIIKSRVAHKEFRSCAFARWTAKLWMRRSSSLRIKYNNYIQRQQAYGALTSDWACIHSYEGAWNANTGNGYYGGLQMDWNFMSAYGPEFFAKWGTADHWPVWAQIVAANRAKETRGYSPWPNTARYCGLL